MRNTRFPMSGFNDANTLYMLYACTCIMQYKYFSASKRFYRISYCSVDFDFMSRSVLFQLYSDVS